MPTKKPFMKIYVTPEENEQIILESKRFSLSLSAYVRRICLGEVLPARDYQHAVRDMLRINADLGRLGGLFKLWLGDENRQAKEQTSEIRFLLREIDTRQRELKAAILRIK